jgi:hypothetical protein
MSMLFVVDPLDGINDKLARADAHFDAVQQAIQKIVDSEPDLIPGEFDAQLHHYIFRAQREGQRPAFLGPVIGDCVHNLKAALDYIAWALAPEAAKSSKGATSIEFPIFTDSTAYSTGAPKKIGSLDPGAQTVIEKLQPFYGPNSDPFDPRWRDPKREPLAYLYELDKWDKHRSLNFTEDIISTTLVGFDQFGPEVHTPRDPFVFPARLERGAILAAADVPNGSPEVKVYLRAAYDVAFDQWGPARLEPVVKTLDNIRKEVRFRVLPALTRFLPA